MDDKDVVGFSKGQQKDICHQHPVDFSTSQQKELPSNFPMDFTKRQHELPSQSFSLVGFQCTVVS
jgi:hypothetical protein